VGGVQLVVTGTFASVLGNVVILAASLGVGALRGKLDGQPDVGLEQLTLVGSRPGRRPGATSYPGRLQDPLRRRWQFPAVVLRRSTPDRRSRGARSPGEPRPGPPRVRHVI